MQEELYNVHVALSEAQQENKEEYEDKTAMETFTSRIHEDVRETANSILKLHGVTLSQFCRKCVEGLVRDYNP